MKWECVDEKKLLENVLIVDMYACILLNSRYYQWHKFCQAKQVTQKGIVEV